MCEQKNNFNVILTIVSFETWAHTYFANWLHSIKFGFSSESERKNNKNKNNNHRGKVLVKLIARRTWAQFFSCTECTHFEYFMYGMNEWMNEVAQRTRCAVRLAHGHSHIMSSNNWNANSWNDFSLQIVGFAWKCNKIEAKSENEYLKNEWLSAWKIACLKPIDALHSICLNGRKINWKRALDVN